MILFLFITQILPRLANLASPLHGTIVVFAAYMVALAILLHCVGIVTPIGHLTNTVVGGVFHLVGIALDWAFRGVRWILLSTIHLVRRTYMALRRRGMSPLVSSLGAGMVAIIIIAII